MAKGLLIIPEGVKAQKSLPTGTPPEVSQIYMLDEMLAYARRRDYTVLYLTSAYGVVSEGSVIGDSVLKVGSLPDEKQNRWVLLISEEIARACVEYNTQIVYLMCKEYAKYQRLVTELKSRGIELHTPLLGKSSRLRKEILSY